LSRADFAFAEQLCGEIFGNARLGHPFSVAPGARRAAKILFVCILIARSAEQILGNVRYLARAARRKCWPMSEIWRAQRGENLAVATMKISAFAAKGK
jgi:hypothetical protein